VAARPHTRLRRALIEACLAMNRLGINQGKAGNASARVPEGLLITPSGMAYDRMKPDDIVTIDSKGEAHGTNAPSSEWRFHYDILRTREDVGAVLHAHPPFATALACLGMEIPAFHYMVAVAGGDSIRCAPYATFGTQALSDNALQALDGRHACLLANHGLICVADSPETSLDLAVEIEALAQQYWRALQIGTPRILPADEMRTVLGKFRTYGRR
jgi:L-fuculose-phosphate aldolase